MAEQPREEAQLIFLLEARHFHRLLIERRIHEGVDLSTPHGFGGDPQEVERVAACSGAGFSHGTSWRLAAQRRHISELPGFGSLQKPDGDFRSDSRRIASEESDARLAICGHTSS